MDGEPVPKRVVVGIISRKRNTTNETEYLLVSSKRNFGPYTGFYYPPGGHLEEGEKEREALARELRQELGESFATQIILLRKISESPGDVKDQITIWWECSLSRDENNIQIKTDELHEVVWMTCSEIESSAKIWPATRLFFESYFR